MSSTPSNQNRDVWERWNGVWHVILGAIIAVTLIATLTSGTVTTDQIVQLLALYAGFTVWHVITMFVPISWFRQHTLYTLMYFIVMGVLWWALIRVNPISLMLMAMLCPNFFMRLPARWAAVCTVLATIIVLAVTVPLENFSAEAATGGFIMLFSMLASIPLGLFINSLINQNLERKRLIEELQAARESLAQAERQAGALEERERLSHDIHDRLAQSFISIILSLEAVEAVLPIELVGVWQQIEQTKMIARESLADSRRLVWTLRPELVERGALSDALQRLSTRWSQESGISAEVSITGKATTLPAPVDIMLLRTTREALNNIAKHAKAQNAAITLSYMGDMIALDIQDDGKGLAGAEHPDLSGGFGLKSLRHSIEQMGGTLSLEASPEGRTTLTLSMPLVIPFQQEITS